MLVAGAGAHNTPAWGGALTFAVSFTPSDNVVGRRFRRKTYRSILFLV